jgi:hypothetical protein
MTTRLLNALVLALAPLPALAAIPGRGFDLPNHTWAATHIVLVENEKVVESWKGDLKIGANLPDGAAAYARIKPPAFSPDWLKTAGQQPPAPTGKRMLLFLAHMPRYGEKEAVWMGAECPGFPRHPPSADTVAWVEGDRVYTIGGRDQAWMDGLGSPDSLANLKEEVDRGLKLQKLFEAASADPDLEKRVGRLVALLPSVADYADLWGEFDAFPALTRCGKAAVPILARWAVDPQGRYRHEAMPALCRIGDDAVDAVLKILDVEMGQWTVVAAALQVGQTVQGLQGSEIAPWRSPNGLNHLLGSVRAMKISAANQKRIREHPGLVELDRLMTTHPGMKPPKSDMESVHPVLRDILAGKFQPND